MKVGDLEVRLVHARKDVKRLDDGDNAIGPGFHAGDELGEITLKKVEINGLGEGFDLVRGFGAGGLVVAQEVENLIGVVGGVEEIALNEVDGIVDFMGHACDELTEARHFFSLDQLDLGAIEIAEGLFKSIAFLAEF